MKELLVICALIAVGSTSEDIFFSEKNTPKPTFVPSVTLHNGSYFPKLDHFNPQDARTVEFQYRLNLDFYRDEGPLFVYINDGEQYTTEWIEEGLIVDIARELGGAVITSDHRYWRLNTPTESSSFDNLRFLTVDQAIADIATLIHTLRDHLSSTFPRVIVWGTGYGATLATFARKKYPHLIDGAFASSGLFRAEVSDESYFDNLSYNLRHHGSDECFGRVKNAFDVLEYLIENAEGDYLQERLRLCQPLEVDNDQEVGFLIERLVDYISAYIKQHNLFGLENFCRDMSYYNEDTLNSLIRWVLYVYDGPECYNIDYEEYIEELTQTNWDARFASRRALAYLRCTQIGAFRIPSDYEFTAFPQLLTDEYHYKFCEDILGEQYNRTSLQSAVDNLNLIYGGQEQVISHVIYTNAGLDPWISHGVSEYGLVESTAIFIQYAAAGADLSSISTEDSAELYRAKQLITEYVTRWARV
ncbi:hypothetical protein HA402_006027 [Bradysia odoriphaga]|nr:hypothetical protein HA402_006027 [Bradysia odoriphaga]